MWISYCIDPYVEIIRLGWSTQPRSCRIDQVHSSIGQEVVMTLPILSTASDVVVATMSVFSALIALVTLHLLAKRGSDDGR